MTQPDEDSDWQFEIPADGSVNAYRGNDLTSANAVGNRVSKLRTDMGLTAQEVEDYAGVPKANLLAIEAGLLQLDAVTAELLSKVLSISVAELRG